MINSKTVDETYVGTLYDGDIHSVVLI